jgi:hypothetical protein
LVSFVDLSDGCEAAEFKGDIVYLPISRLHRGCGGYATTNYRLYVAHYHSVRPRKMQKIETN